MIKRLIGGELPDGSDVCNDLIRLILHRMEDLRTKESCVSFCYHDKVDDETLIAAQKELQKYRNTLVRVAGYSAYFVDLEKDIQDNIIARTLQKTM